MTQETLRIALAAINAANFQGKDIEEVIKAKQEIQEALVTETKEEKKK